MKRIALFSLSAAAMLFAGCEEKVNPGTEPGTDPGTEPETPAKVVFKVEATNILENGVTVSITHDGTPDNTYYGFHTTDVTTDENTLVEAKVAELKASGTALDQILWKGKTFTRPVMNLTPSTDYKYIVFGLNADGTLYGTNGVCTFTTSESTALQFKENPNWKVTYDGKEITDNGLAEKITVTSQDNERFFTGVFAATILDEYSIEDICEAALDNLITQVGEAWAEFTYTATASESYNPLETGKEYIAFAIGVDEEGELTGLYAQSETFVPEELTGSDEYSKWLGNWILTDGQDKSYPITVSANIPDVNYSVSMVNEWYPAIASFDKEKETMSFIASVILENVDFGQPGPGNLIFAGVAPRGEGRTVITGDYPICEMILDPSENTANGNQTPQELELSNGDIVTLTAMTWFAMPYSGGVYSYDVPEYSVPLKTMVKVEAPATASADMNGALCPVGTKLLKNSYTSLAATTAKLMDAVSAR